MPSYGIYFAGTLLSFCCSGQDAKAIVRRPKGLAMLCLSKVTRSSPEML